MECFSVALSAGKGMVCGLRGEKMPDSRRRKAMIRQRMAITGLDWIPASKAIGSWWKQNMTGQSPKSIYYTERTKKNGGP